MSKVRTGHQDVFIGKKYPLVNGISVQIQIQLNIAFIITPNGYLIFVIQNE
jgi:hypothetical protein